MDGVGFLAEAMDIHPQAKRALLTAYADTNAAIDAINEARIHYYLMKPWDPPEEKLFPGDRRSFARLVFAISAAVRGNSRAGDALVVAVV